MGQWVTPNSANTGTRTIAVRVPDDEYLYSCLVGCVLLLVDSFNWEKVGDMTPAEISALFDPTFTDLAANAQ